MRERKVSRSCSTHKLLLYSLFLYLFSLSNIGDHVFFLSWFITFLRLHSTRGGSLSNFPDEGNNVRRILHQPLFPATSPPPPSGPDFPDPADNPFFHELPNGPTPDQSQHSLPTQASNSVAATHAHNPTKRVAIGITSGFLSIAILSALVFYLYKRRSKHPDEAQNLFGSNPRRAREESRMPPSTFLYIGTVDPSTTSVANETSGGANGSPYRKLKPGKLSDRYRPSPDLQPLPPLPKALPQTINSPPPMSSSDDESRGTGFYAQKGSSSISNGSPNSRHNYSNNNNRLPLSRKASPKSRLSALSLDTRHSIIPSIKQLPPPESSSLGPLQPSKTLPYTPKRAKYAAPPPPPDMVKLRSISNDDQQTRKIPIPPPPPPSIPRKFGSVGPNTPSPVVSKQATRPESESPGPVAITGVNSSEKCDREDKEGSKPKLKALHWDKVRATSERATVWDQLKSSSFQLNEDAMESLFGCTSANSAPKEAGTRKPALEQENRVLDPKKSQNIAILIRALNVTREEVSEALLDGNPDGLGGELLETLVKMAPTKEEEIKLKDYNGDITRLGSAERFLKRILAVPFAFKRAEAMLYRANFYTEVAYLRNSFQTLEEASEELKNSRMFLKLLEAVLRTGNRMNDGTNRGDARAFKLNTLLKLADVKGADGKTTLLHFVVQEIIRSDGSQSLPNKTNFKQEEFRKQGLQVVSGLSKELSNIRKAAGMDSDVLSGYVSKLETGLEKVRLVTQYKGGKFSNSMKEFLREAVGEIARIKREERIVMSRVKELTEYFHGDAAKEEAHPLRIFLIVRDFLGILGNVCRDVGRMQDDGTSIAAGRSFRMPTNVSLPVFSRYHAGRGGSSE